jgi:hypothetical protein
MFNRFVSEYLLSTGKILVKQSHKPKVITTRPLAWYGVRTRRIRGHACGGCIPSRTASWTPDSNGSAVRLEREVLGLW